MSLNKNILKFSLPSAQIFYCPPAVPACLEKRTKLFIVVCYFVPDVSVNVKLLGIQIVSGETAAILSKNSLIFRVRYESHLSDKARCSEVSQFSITKI